MAIPLSDNIYTESNKPADARYGPYASTSLAKSSVPVPYRHIGLTVGILEEGKVVDYWWESGTDDTDLIIKSSDGTGPSETPESIKTKYESNENTNAFTDAEKSKLSGIATDATKNSNTDELSEGAGNKYFTEARAVASKLAGYVKAATVSAITSATSILEAIGILEKALDNKVDKVAGSGLITDAEKLIFADKYTKNETDNLISGAISSLIWKDDVAEFSDLATEYPDAIEGWTSVVNNENKIYRFDGTNWVPIGDITIPMATETVDGKMSKENFVKLRDIEAEATKNTNTDELAEGTTNKYFTDARAIAAKIDGYVKAETPIPLAETDSILQALGKLEGLLDTKIPIRGDNFIATRPTANKAANGVHLQNIINELASFTPGGNPLSHTNRAYVLVMPGEYNGDIYLGSPYIDIIGFGSKNGIIINGNIEADFDLNQDHRIENLVVNGNISCYNHTEVCVYKNLTVDAFRCDTLGVFENIEHSGIGDYLFEGISGGTLRNIYTPKALGGSISVEFEGIIEDCRAEGQHDPIGLSGIVTRSYFKGNNAYDAIFDLHDGAEISYTIIINESDQGTGTEWAVTNFKRFGAPDTDKEVRIHHCHFEAKDGALSPKVINTITNGHNSWDSEESGSDGYSTPADVRDALQSLTGENRLDASAIKNLPSTGLTPEQEAKLENVPANTISELGNKVDKEEGKGLSSNDYTSAEKNKLKDIEEEAQKNVQSDWNQENSNSDDFIKNKPELFSGSFDDLEDVPSSFPSTIEDVNGLGDELGGLQDQITTNEKERIFVVNFRDKLEYIFEWTESIKINSIKVKPGSGQTIDLGDYVLGDTLQAWTPLEITSNQFGVVELIGEISQEEEFNTHSLVIPSFGTGIEILDNSIYPWSTDSQNDKPISFEICFKPTLMANLGYIVRFEDDSGLKLGIMHEYDGRARIDFQMSNGNRLSGRTGSGQILVDEWNHFIFTYNGSKLLSGIKIYKKNNAYLSLNGASSQGNYNGLQNLSGNLKIKVPVTPGTEANKFIGKINFFRIFEKELTQVESDSLLDNWGPISIDESYLKQYCVLEHRFNNNLLSNIGKDAIAVGNLTYDNDVPAVVSYPDNTLNFTTTELDSLYWPGIYKSSDWPMLDISKPYFTIYSSDHSTTGGGIAWGECDDVLGNGFVEKGVIVSGSQAETPILLHVPLSVSGLSEDEVFLYYHTSAGEPGNDGKQQTRLITCSGGVLHNTQWTDRGRPLGIYNDDAHTGYATPRFNSNGKIVASHLTIGGSNPKFYTSISDDGLVFTRSIQTTNLTVDNYQYLKNEVRDFKWNDILYGFVGLRVGGLIKIAVAILDDNFIPSSIVYMLDKFYDIRQMMINVEGSIAYIRFKGGDNTNRFEPYYQITFNLELLNEI